MATDLAAAVRIQVLDAFSAPLRDLGLQLSDATGKAKKLGKSFDLAASLSLASDAVGKFADAAKSAVTAPANEFITFEHQMSKVGAVGDLTGDKLERLKKQALELGAATRYSATEAAQAQENLVSAGFSVDNIMKLTPVSLRLATAADLELARSSEIVAGTLKAFGKEASEAANVADVLASAAAVSSADVEYLAEVTSKAGPIAKQLGISLETVAAAGSLFAEAQFEASVGGTALKTVLLRLSAPANDAKKAFRQLHIGGRELKKIQEELGKGNLPGVLATIGKSFDKLGLSATERVEKLKHIFGDEAAAQASVLIDAALRVDENQPGFQQLEEAYKNVDNAAAKMAARMDDDTAGSLTRLGSAWSGFLIELGEKLAPTIVQISESIQPVLGSIGDWVSKNPELAGTIGRLAVAVTAGAFALKAGLVVASTAVTTYAVAAKAVKLLGGAVSLLATGITKLIPAAGAVAGFTAGTVALAVAAGAVGYAIGTLINKLFGLDEKIIETIGWITGQDLAKPKSNKTRGMGGSSERTYADGTVIDTKTGEVKKLGTGPTEAAPSMVREARESGARTAADVNAFTKRKAEEAAAAAKPTSAGGAAASSAEAATREQTVRLEREMRDQKQLSRELLEETKRGNRRRAAVAGGSGAGEL